MLDDVTPIAVYPFARFMRASDVFVGAAGYNTSCEALQSRVPNTQVADHQTRRDEMVAKVSSAVICLARRPSKEGRVERLLALAGDRQAGRMTFDLSGTERAADEIFAPMGAGRHR